MSYKPKVFRTQYNIITAYTVIMYLYRLHWKSEAERIIFFCLIIDELC